MQLYVNELSYKEYINLQEVTRQVKGCPLYVTRVIEVIAHHLRQSDLSNLCQLLLCKSCSRGVVFIPENQILYYFTTILTRMCKMCQVILVVIIIYCYLCNLHLLLFFGRSINSKADYPEKFHYQMNLAFGSIQ